MRTNRRGEPRVRKRIPCLLTVGDREYKGVVLDVSAHGLFVQTVATVKPGTSVRVAIIAPQRDEPLEVETKVARTKLVPPRLRTVAQGGIGLHVAEPPETFRTFVEEVQRPVKVQKVSILSDKPASAPAREEKPLTKDRLDRFFAKGLKLPRRRSPKGEKTGAGPQRKLPRWRVQLRQLDGEGQRSFIVSSESEDDARVQVEAELDAGWKIEGIERL